MPRSSGGGGALHMACRSSTLLAWRSSVPLSTEVQVVLSGAAHHAPPESAAGGMSSGGSSAAVAVGPGGGVEAVGEQHPLRIYWEYLSYLFRWVC